MLNEFKSLEGIPYEENVKLDKFCTFKVGGKCKAMIFPRTIKEFNRAIAFCGENYIVLGNGSNVLVSDKGFDGYVISTLRLKKVHLSGNILRAECGANIRDILRLATENSMGGLEFAVGIPGTIGGLVAMNGGCFNKSISDIVCYVISASGAYNNQGCEFDYRSSRFTNDPIFEVGLKLRYSEFGDIDKKIQSFIGARKSKQPKGNSCGSVFLNEGYFAGKLIDQAGLKGYRIGGAFVSKEHGNFIINENGTAKDIYDLIAFIKSTVYQKLGIELHEEVRYIGEF